MKFTVLLIEITNPYTLNKIKLLNDPKLNKDTHQKLKLRKINYFRRPINYDIVNLSIFYIISYLLI